MFSQTHHVRRTVISTVFIFCLVVSLLYYPMFYGTDNIYAEGESPTTITITFDPNGGKSETKTKTVTTGSIYHSMPTPTKTRSTFLGWYTSKTNGEKIESGSTVTFTANTTLYAHWKKEKYFKYKFNANGGKVGTKSKKYKYNSKVKSLPKPKRAKYEFKGWYTKTHGGAKITNGKRITSKSTSQTLYARWAPKQFSQSDGRWANKSHGNGSTIARSGCGPSTMSMVVATIKNNSVTPAVAARWSVSHGYKTSAAGKTKDGFFSKFPKKYGIKSTRVTGGNLKKMSKSKSTVYHKEAKEAVRNGDWVVAFMSPGTWTHHGHFILWYDIEGNRALVRDPNGMKASKTRNYVSTLQRQAWRYWIISVPYNKMISPPTEGKIKSGDGVSVRSGASSDTSLLGSLDKGDKIKITNKKDGWWKIEYKGGTGYVSEKNVTVTK